MWPMMSDSLNQQASAWEAVVQVLDQVSPGWNTHYSGLTTKQLAIAAIHKLARLAAPEGWVSIEDRLPEIDQSVALVNIHRWEACSGAMERNVHDAGYLSDLHGQKFWSVRGERAQSVTAFTHWMPLPLAPQDGSTQK